MYVSVSQQIWCIVFLCGCLRISRSSSAIHSECTDILTKSHIQSRKIFLRRVSTVWPPPKDSSRSSKSVSLQRKVAHSCAHHRKIVATNQVLGVFFSVDYWFRASINEEVASVDPKFTSSSLQHATDEHLTLFYCVWRVWYHFFWLWFCLLS